MNQNLRKTVLDNRQFVGLLLLAFAASSLVVSLMVALTPPDDSLEAMTAKFQAEVGTLEKLGFLFPPVQSFLPPLVVVTGLLAAIYFSLRTQTHRSRHV